MALTITATSTDDVYTTTAYVKGLMGVTGTSDDATLSAVIRAASRWADSYVGYPLYAQKYRETVPGYGVRKLMLNRTPLRAVPALYLGTDTDDNDAFLASEFRVENREAAFLSRDEGFDWTVPVQQELVSRPRPGEEYRPWMIDYVAGYTYGGLTTDSSLYSTAHGTTSTGRTLPEDIEHAVALRAHSMYRGQDGVAGDIKSASVGGIKVEKQGWTAGGNSVRTVLSPEELMLLEYVRIK